MADLTLDRSKGYMLVIVNTEFKHFRTLDVSKEDVKLCQELNTKLNCKLDLKENVDLDATKSMIAEAVEAINASDEYEWLMVVISSHGELAYNNTIRDSELVIRCKDSLKDPGVTWMPTRDIVEAFGEKKCRKLKNKPKIFIIAACRGSIHSFYISVVSISPWFLYLRGFYISVVSISPWFLYFLSSLVT